MDVDLDIRYVQYCYKFQFDFIKNIDSKIFAADKSGSMNGRFLHCTLQQRRFKSSAHNVQHADNKTSIVEVLQEDSQWQGVTLCTLEH